MDQDSGEGMLQLDEKRHTKLLQDMPIFGGISDTTLTFLLQHSDYIEVQEGGYFFLEGDTAESMFILEQGLADILKHWKDQEIVLRQLNQGDCFGEMALMDLMPRSASVRTCMDCRAIELPRNALYELFKIDMEQFALIQMNMGREVSRRLRDADNRFFEVQRGTDASEPGHIFRWV